jgi:hypothetical protein
LRLRSNERAIILGAFCLGRAKSFMQEEHLRVVPGGTSLLTKRSFSHPGQGTEWYVISSWRRRTMALVFATPPGRGCFFDSMVGQALCCLLIYFCSIFIPPNLKLLSPYIYIMAAEKPPNQDKKAIWERPSMPLPELTFLRMWYVHTSLEDPEKKTLETFLDRYKLRAVDLPEVKSCLCGGGEIIGACDTCGEAVCERDECMWICPWCMDSYYCAGCIEHANEAYVVECYANGTPQYANGVHCDNCKEDE